MSDVMVYELGTDELRPITQDDVDKFQTAAMTNGVMVRALRKAYMLHPEIFPEPVPPSGPQFQERMRSWLTKFLDN